MSSSPEPVEPKLNVSTAAAMASGLVLGVIFGLLINQLAVGIGTGCTLGAAAAMAIRRGSRQWMLWLGIYAAIVAVAFVLWMSGALTPKFHGTSRLSTTVGDREIKATIDGAAFIQPQSDGAIVTTASQKVVIERERVLLGESELAKLPAAAKKIELTISSGQLSLTADGTEIVTQKLQP